MHNEKIHKLTVEIDNLTKAQALALESMFHQYMSLGQTGASRWVDFYADGDGNFQPKIIVNGHAPEFSSFLDSKEIWKTDECRIDFDSIAWKTDD